MSRTYSDSGIEELIAERKPLPPKWRDQMRLRPKRGHEERELDLTSDVGNEFRVILRRSMVNILDFSIILAVRVPKSSQLFRLQRYNGKSHEHKNHIESNSFYGFHIHMATERYQEMGTREDAYAEITNKYGDYSSALRCFIEDMNLGAPTDDQLGLFREV